MKLLYIAPTERTKEIRHDWHALDLGNGQHLVCVRWKDEMHELEWSQNSDVVALPHPIYQPAAEIPEEHLQHLRGRFSLPAKSNVHHVIKQAAGHDPWMRLHVL